jgi:hypothetical protein
LGQPGLVAAMQDDARASGGQTLRDGEAQAAGAAGDQS